MLLNLKDHIIYVSKDEISDDIKDALKDYTFMKVDPTFKAKDEANLEERKDLIEHNPAVMQLEKAADSGNDSIVIVDHATKIDDDEARLVTSRLLKMGVPFIVMQREKGELPQKFRDAVIYRYDLSDKDSKEEIAKLSQQIDSMQQKGIGIFTRTMFFEKSVRLFWFDFGKSDNDQLDITGQILMRTGPSLSITVPAFLLGMAICIFVAMISAYCRGNYVDRSITIVCIAGMSVVSLFYYFAAQYGIGAWLKIAPVSGYAYGFSAINFVMLPILISVISGFGGSVRYYRTLFLEEINKDYVKTARSKGMTELRILFKHVLKNAMIPILTGVVMALPALFVGSLILEAFFGIPGLGGFTLEGIQAQDFRIVGSMVYLGTFIQIIALLLTDLSYTLVDPRVKLS
jgi:peptide/nickel transport system permease protein